MAKGKAKEELNIEDLELEEETPAKGKKGGKSKSSKADKASEVEAPAKGKKAKKEAAQEAKPKGKPPGREPLPEGFVSAEDLAAEFGKEPRAVRQVLRDNEIAKPESGRWAWHAKKDASMLKQIRGLLGGTSKKEKKEKEAPAKAEALKGKKGKKEEAAPVEEKKSKKKKDK